MNGASVLALGGNEWSRGVRVDENWTNAIRWVKMGFCDTSPVEDERWQ